MRRLVYLLAAERDLAAIFDYLADASGQPKIALRFTAELRAHCARLATRPGTLGTPRPELRPDLRSIAHKGYVILFRYRQDTLEIINIIEGHRPEATISIVAPCDVDDRSSPFYGCASH